MHERVSIAFGSGRHQEGGVFGVGQLQHVLSTDRTYFESFDGVVEVVLGARRRCHVDDGIEGAVDHEGLHDVPFDEIEGRHTTQVLEILEAASEQVIQPDNRVTFAQKPIAKMGANKPRGAGDENAQALLLPDFILPETERNAHVTFSEVI